MNTLELTEPEKPATRGKEVVNLPYGLLGFESVKSYSLLTRNDETPFLRLQMLQNPKHSFLVLPPGTAVPDYQPDIAAEDADFLGLEDATDAFILNIVTLRNGGKATINLKGPIVINRRTWVGKQVIPVNGADFSVRHPLPVS